MERLVLKSVVPPSFSGTACDFLAAESGLSRSKIKDAMNKGAVWTRKKAGGRQIRLRRARARLYPGDCIDLCYDGALLAVEPPEAKCIGDQGRYSAWYKPAGLLAQGTMFGDHCSLLRQAELSWKKSREVFLVHRLDRETEGIMLIAHDADAAARLSALFREKKVLKKYRAVVLGDLRTYGKEGVIRLPLDGKQAITEFEALSCDAERKTTEVSVIIRTGRFHQIRRHFDMIGFPVIGDPKYGRGNKNAGGMKLIAVSLRFPCPFNGRDVEYDSGC